MGGGWVARRNVGDLDDLEGWMAQRNADISLRPDAEAAGREAWEQATRDGQDLAAARPNDLVALGASVLNSSNRGSWSGKGLGLTKYGPLGQFWFGTTTPLKTAAGAELLTNDALTDQATDRDSPP